MIAALNGIRDPKTEYQELMKEILELERILTAVHELILGDEDDEASRRALALKQAIHDYRSYIEIRSGTVRRCSQDSSADIIRSYRPLA